MRARWYLITTRDDRPWRGGAATCRAACVCGLIWTGGCVRPTGAPTPSLSALTVDDILGRCVTAYAELETLQARGLLRDYRADAKRAAAIRWDLARPDRCRLQIELDVALISGEHWWTYEAATGRFGSHPQFSRTPIETATFLFSDGLEFLLPAIMIRGAEALGKTRAGGFADWTMEGVDWHAESPCYVVSRPGWGTDRGRIWRLWIDQDRFLVRGWALTDPRRRRRDRIVAGCSYYDLVANERLPADRFRLTPPKPILLTSPEAARTLAAPSGHG